MKNLKILSGKGIEPAEINSITRIRVSGQKELNPVPGNKENAPARAGTYNPADPKMRSQSGMHDISDKNIFFHISFLKGTSFHYSLLKKKPKITCLGYS